MSEKKYIVRLTDSERKVCTEVIGKLKGTGQKVRRAQILLKADADGPAWTDAQIAEAFSCRTKTVENVRQRLVELGFEQTLDRKKSPTAGAKKLLDGSEDHCNATWFTTRRLRKMDTASVGSKGCRVGGCGNSQP